MPVHAAALRPVALLLLALLGATLQGCVSWRAPTAIDANAANAGWLQRQQQLGAVSGFETNGRIAIKGGGLSGGLRWQQQGEQFRLRIAGPFGAGATLIEGVPARVKIKSKDMDLDTTEPQRVLQQSTGWLLPLDALRWWALGIPAPGDEAPSALLDALGRPTEMQQRGWRLRYSDYREETPLATPGRIEASQGDWSATVIFEQITLSP